MSGKPGLHTLRAFVMQITTDMRAGDKLLTATGHNCYRRNLFRFFRGVCSKTWYNFPRTDPRTGEVISGVHAWLTSRLSSRTMAANVLLFASSRISGRHQSHNARQSKQCGLKRNSLLCCPNPSDSQVSAPEEHLKYRAKHCAVRLHAHIAVIPILAVVHVYLCTIVDDQ